jgi:hypothetical protein
MERGGTGLMNSKHTTIAHVGSAGGDGVMGVCDFKITYMVTRINH